jgi:hypothetical protein
MSLLFSCVTLQRQDAQLSAFGRILQGEKDELPGFERSLIRIEDPQAVTAVGIPKVVLKQRMRYPYQENKWCDRNCLEQIGRCSND